MGHVILSMGLGILCLCGAFAAGAEEGGSIRMDEPAFFRALELDAAELGAVRAAVDAEDWAGARAAFVGHLKARERPRWHRDWRERPRTPTPPGKPGKNQRIADDALEHRFTSTGLAHEFDGPIDWAHNPTAEPDSERAHNPEWTWQFNRHPFWQSLGWAYWETGDERYAEEFVREMTDWVRANPVPEPRADQARFSRWRTIEAGIRMGHSWPDAFALFLSSPSFSDEAVVTMVRSMAEHARYLLAHPTKGNWLTMEMNGLYTVGALFPELRESAAWRRFAAERLRTELDTQFYPDGAQKELAPGYHFVALENTRCVLRLAQLNGLEVPAGYAASMERLYTYPLMLMTPDRGLPPFNDSRWRANGLPRRMAEGHGHFPARDDFLWVATDGKEGRPPAETSHAFPYAGYVIQRSGWDRDARYLAFDAGPFGTGHQHEDKLNFVLMAYGRRLIVEGGIYMYDASPWRRYVLGPYAHNVVFVDGLGQNRRAAPETREAAEPLPFVWHTTDRVDYAQASYGGASEGYGQEPQWIATHTRRILFVKNGADAPGDFWIVADTLAPRDDQPHRYESVFHLDAPGVDTESVPFGVCTQDEGGPNLGLFALAAEGLSLTVVEGQEEPVIQGWIPLDDSTLTGVRPIPTPVFAAERAGVAHALYVLYPVAEGPVPAVAVTPWSVPGAAPEDGASAGIAFAGGPRYRVFFAENPGRAWEVDGETATGPFWLGRLDGGAWRRIED